MFMQTGLIVVNRQGVLQKQTSASLSNRQLSVTTISSSFPHPRCYLAYIFAGFKHRRRHDGWVPPDQRPRHAASRPRRARCWRTPWHPQFWRQVCPNTRWPQEQEEKRQHVGLRLAGACQLRRFRSTPEVSPCNLLARDFNHHQRHRPVMTQNVFFFFPFSEEIILR